MIQGNHLRGKSIAVIGAGIGGLTAALALSQRGADVRIYERAPAFGEVGAGIQIAPNAAHVFAALGLHERFKNASIPVSRGEIRDRDAHLLAALAFGEGYRLIGRPALIDLLAGAVTEAGIAVSFNQEVTPQNPPEADLVIAADGLRSRWREQIDGRSEARFTNQTAWRALIEDTTPEWDSSTVFLAPGKHLVSYPLPNSLRNIVAVEERSHWSEEGWHIEGDPEQLCAEFSGFGGPVRDWLDAVKTTQLWALYQRPVARRWHDTGRVLLGDAAHPTLPFLAQGAAMAIEDSWILAACLDYHADQDTALDRYVSLRAPRCTRIVAESTANARRYHASGLKRQAISVGLRAMSRAAPDVLIRRYSWLYDYNPIDERIA